MLSEKNKKLIKIAVTCIIIILIVWFLILNPYLKFKSQEKTMTDAGKRYYEVNSKMLPTGEKIGTVTLEKLYDKDYISEDLKIPYSKKICDSKTSWVKVKKVKGEYKYYSYLKCGVFSSNVDHKGPTITLKGDEEVVLNNGDKYNDPGIESVIDNVDGKISIKKVKVDSSKVDLNKNGTYEIKYKVKDSFNNETIKIRTIKVEQILDKTVKNSTDKTNIYKGAENNNYVMIDGIIFRIVGLNNDGTVKVVSDTNLAFVDYNHIDEWLNDYFYNSLSDSAKKLIVNQKVCNDKVTDPTTFSKCKSYSKKKTVGLLSIADINNSRNKELRNNFEIEQYSWLNNAKGNKQYKVSTKYNYYNAISKSNISGIRPVLNIRKNETIVSGDGSNATPYILKSNKQTLNPGASIKETKTGEYIDYSGYKWRIINNKKDNNIKVVMDTVLKGNSESNVYYYDIKNNYYNPSIKNNIGYIIENKISSFVSTKNFEKTTTKVYKYKNKAEYNSKTKYKEYKSLLSEVSMYDMFSTSSSNNYWFIESTSELAYYNNPKGDIGQSKINEDNTNLLKITAILNEKLTIKSGKGTINSPYLIEK